MSKGHCILAGALEHCGLVGCAEVTNLFLESILFGFLSIRVIGAKSDMGRGPI